MEQSKLDSKELQKIFFEINRGYSRCEYEGTPIFIRHSNLEEGSVTQEFYEKYYNKAKKMGLMNESELLEFLNKEELWTAEEESLSKSNEIEISQLRQTASNLIIKKQKEDIAKKIKVLEKEISKNKIKRLGLVRNTCEEYASKRSNEQYVFYCVYKDEKLEEIFFTPEEYEELERAELYGLYEIYNDSTHKFNPDNLAQIGMEGFFTSYFNLFGDDVSRFFNKPVLELTYYQVNLLSYGRMFNNIFKNYDDIPEGIRNNAKKLLEYVEDLSKKSSKIERTKDRARQSIDGGFTHAGASKDDLREAGIDVDNAKDIHEASKEYGKDGEMDMEDFIRMHGK